MSLLTNFQDLVRTLNHVLAKKADKTDVSSVESKVDSLSTVAKTGSYDDLKNKPAYAPVATTGDYYDLNNKPSLANVATSGSYLDLNSTPIFAAVATTGSYTDLLDKPSLATVATSGSYNDLSDKPAIPDATDVPFPVTISVDTATSATISEPWTKILEAYDAGRKIQIYADYYAGNVLTDCSVKKENGKLLVYARYFYWWQGTYSDLYVTDINATYTISSGAVTWDNQAHKVVPDIPSAGTISQGSQGYAKGGDVYTALSAKQNTLPTGAAGNILYWTGSAWSTMAPPSGFVAQSTAPTDTSALWIDTDDDTIEGFVDGNNMAF